MAEKTLTLSLAAALAGAVALATVAMPTIEARAQDAKVKCYGIAKKGENDCANAAGTHSCAGQSKADLDGGDWRYVKAAADCEKAGGKSAAFKGMNQMKKGS